MLASSPGLIGLCSSSLSSCAQQHSPANSIASHSANFTRNKANPSERLAKDRFGAGQRRSASGVICGGNENVTAFVSGGQLEHGRNLTGPPDSSNSSCQQLTSGITTTTTTARANSTSSHLNRNQQVQRLTRMFSHWRTRREAPELPRWPAAPMAVINERLGVAHELVRQARHVEPERHLMRGPSRLEVRLSPAAALVARHLAQNAQTPASSGGPAEAHVALSMTQNHTAHSDTPRHHHHHLHNIHHHHHHHRHHHASVDESGGGAPNGTSCAGDDDGTDLKSQRPWQSLLLPVVSACVIFLVALWTRQISLAITNDKILMIMILIGLFIVMSGLALWLSCDQYLDDELEAGRTDSEAPAHHDGTAAQVTCHCDNHHHSNGDASGDQRRQSASSHLHQCHHNHNNHHHCQHRHQAAGHSATNASATGARRCQKCCGGGISVIDCQPPDYYSAVKNSVPIQHYLILEHENKRNTTKRTNESSNEEEEEGNNDLEGTKSGGSPGDNHLYLSPPSYEELLKRSRGEGE